MNALTRIEAPAAIEADPPLLWEGRPRWRSAALRIWKAPAVGLYFGILLADGLWMTMTGAAPRGQAWSGDLILLASGLAAVGILALLAWLTARTTLYRVDEARIVMRFGIALRARLEIPFGAIEHIGVRVHGDRTGDVAIRLKPGQRVSYPKLWPHARPWRLFRAEPMLRCIPEAGVVGALLSREIAAAVEARAAAERGNAA